MPKSNIPGSARKPLRILIVEDEALVAMEIESMLAMAGHDVLALADDLESAVAAVEIELPDLALVDIQLARGCSGLDVAAALQVRGVPVLFASGNCPTDRGRDVALGCLQKPITDRVLAAAIHAVAMTLQGATPTSIPSALRLY